MTCRVVQSLTYNDLSENTVFRSLDVNGRFVGFLTYPRLEKKANTFREGPKLTTSKRTSPAEKDSPSFFFQDEIPPSLMVGLIAGMANLDSALRRAEEWIPGEKRVWFFVLLRKTKIKNIPRDPLARMRAIETAMARDGEGDGGR